MKTTHHRKRKRRQCCQNCPSLTAAKIVESVRGYQSRFAETKAKLVAAVEKALADELAKANAPL